MQEVGFAMMDGMAMGFGWMMGLWVVFALALLMLVILTIIWLIRNLTGGPTRRTDAAEEQLRQRYAAGDIGQDEYRQRLADLRGA